MTQTLAFDDVWKMFQEMVRENRERSAEMDRQLRAMREETDHRIQETTLRIEETDRRMRQEEERRKQEEERRKQEAEVLRKEGERRMQELNRSIQETTLQMRETDRKLDRLGGRLGEFVEGLVAPACKTLFAQRGIPVHKVSRRVEAKLPQGRYMEIDLFVVNTDVVVLVEVKSKLTVDDVREHLVRLSQFKEFFWEYTDKKVIGAVAGMVVEENVSRFAINKGLFVIVQAGDTLCLANDEAFVPYTW